MDFSTTARSLGAFAALTLLVTFGTVAPLQAAGTPVIGAGGIVNVASNRPPDQPGGDIAQGSMFAIYGVEIGPAVGVGVTEFPLENNLAGVEVTITQGATTLNAIPIFVFAGQINAIMPSNAPLGQVEVRVICNGVASEPETVTVVETSIGIFTRDGSGAGPGSVTDLPNFNLNTAANSAMPNEAVTIWATGVGGIDGPDNIPPLNVKGSPGLRDFKEEIGLEVFVGGQPVNQIFYAGRSAGFAALDQIIVELAAGVALGCNTPVYMIARGITSNTVTMATSADGGECSDDAGNPISDNLGTGKNGSIVVARVDANADLGALGLLTPVSVEKGLFGDTVNTTLDLGVASFVEVTETEMIDPALLNMITSFIEMPPYGTCASFNTEDFEGIPGTDPEDGGARPLGAGSPVTLTRTSDGGTRTLALSPESGTAAAILGEGGFQPVSLLLGVQSPQLFLDGGSYRAEAGAGAEIGAWSVDFELPPPVDWTNDASFGTVNRNTNAQFTWTGGNDTQFVEVVLLNVNVPNESAAGVACLARPSDGGITVDASLLSTIPASTPPDVNGDLTSLGIVLVGATQFKDLPTFTAPGLDNGIVANANLNLVTTIFE